MSGYELEPKRFKNITLEAGTSIIPCANNGETFQITLSHHQDHGRRAYLASTIKSRNSLIEVADNLTTDESLRLTIEAGKILDSILNGSQLRSSTVLTSNQGEKPDIHVAIFGDPFKDNSLRLYYHPGEYQGAAVVYQDARTKTRDADKVERTFRREANYKAPQSWESRKGRS